MSTRADAHPADETLAAYCLGKADEETAAAVAGHLETCATCRDRADAVSADSFLGRLRAASGRTDVPAPGKSLSGVARSIGPAAPPGVPPELAACAQFEDIRELGQGGMGVVYKARNRLMGRDEVLKVVNRSMLTREGAIERFLQEIQSAARLQHPNVVAAYSALQLGDLLVFAMEYVPGQDLSQVVKKAAGPLPVASACYYAYQTALGLQHAHEKGMVHRDVKPSNLILTRDGKKVVVKILDFGLAKVSSERGFDSGLTGAGKMLGTPDYMAPEQALDAARADIRADIYSLGCTLYYLLAGRPPFTGKSLFELLQHHQTTEAQPLNLARPDVPAELAGVVARMMAKDPARRYQAPGEVARALAPFVRPGAGPKPGPEVSHDGRGTAAPGGTTPPIAAPAGSRESVGKRAVAAPVPTPPASASDAAEGDPWGTLAGPAETKPVRAARPIAARGVAKKRPWVWPAVAGGVVLAALLVAWAGGVFKVKTRDGTIVLEGLPRDAEVEVDGKTVLVKWPGGEAAEVTVKPGTRHVVVTTGGVKVIGEEVVIEEGGRKKLTARLEPPRGTAQRPVPPETSRTLQTDHRVYEMRVYRATPGKLDALHARFRDHTMKLFARHGMTNVGYFVPTGENEENKLVYFLSYPSMAAREAAWKAFAADPEWLRVRTETDNGGPLVARAEAKFLTPTDYSPPVKVESKGGRVFELRTYTTTKGNLPALDARFRDHTMKLFEKHGMTNVAYWHLLPDQKGAEDTLIYLLAHKSPEAAKASFDAFRQDPEWVRLRAESEKKAGGPLTAEGGVVSEFLTPTDYSPTMSVVQPPVGQVPGTDGWVPLFNGRDLTGWNGLPDLWSVKDGVVIGSTKPAGINFNTFLCSERQYGDFELTCKVRLVGPETANSGIQIRSVVVDPKRFTVRGPQCDIGKGYWGSLYGEGLGRVMKEVDQKVVADALKPDDFNELYVLCVGKRVVIKLNGTATVDGLFPEMADRGILGWQAHAGSGFEVHIKDARVRELPTGADGFVSLFNGRDLTGWEVFGGGTGNWKVVDGAIVSSGPTSHLFSDRGDYTNFHLRVEAMINDGGNSGLYFRTLFRPGWPLGYEAQINATHRDPIRTGSLYLPNVPEVLVKEQLHRPNEWFTQEVIADGNHIVIKVNGKTTVDWKGPADTYTRGHFALQQHDPGTVVRFRKVEVKELPREKVEANGFVPLFIDKNLTGWTKRGTNSMRWNIQDGTLIAINNVNRYGTDTWGRLNTDRSDYGNFHMRFETMLSEGITSTVRIRQQPPTSKAGVKHAYAILLGSKNPGAKYQLPGRPGSLSVNYTGGSRSSVAEAAETHLKPGEWFKMDIIAQGARIRILINGIPAVDYLDVQAPLSAGAIGLDCASFTTLRCRNPEIRELASE